MISGPVTPRTREGLWGQILSRPDLLEQGLQIVAQDLDLHEACTVDGVGRDAAGRAVLLFAVVGPETVGLPVKVLEAHSFLQRNGRLQRDSDAWRLVVESRPFDMLLDQIPWSFATLKFPWMERVIYVEWR